VQEAKNIIEKPCYSVDKGITVCVLPSKDFGKRDIIFVPTEGKAISVRSTTELINKLRDYEIPPAKITDTMTFVSGRLRGLESEEISLGVKAGGFGVEKSKKQKV
jgi:hypothetical protein